MILCCDNNNNNNKIRGFKSLSSFPFWWTNTQWCAFTGPSGQTAGSRLLGLECLLKSAISHRVTV